MPKKLSSNEKAMRIQRIESHASKMTPKQLANLPKTAERMRALGKMHNEDASSQLSDRKRQEKRLRKEI